MKQQSPEPDDRLNSILREWKVADELPPRFQERVWQRISAMESDPSPAGFWTIFRKMASRALYKPSLAYTYALVLLALGMLGGGLVGQTRNLRNQEALSRQYLQSVDPYLHTSASE